MRTEVRVVAAADPGGGTRLLRVAADGQLAVRATGAGPDGAARIHLVGAAAGPLGGDEVRILLEVGPGAGLEVRSAAATLALPGRGPGASAEVRTEVRVAEGGRLGVACEPTVVCSGADLRTVLEVDAHQGAQVRVREVVVLGRHREPPGRWLGRLSAVADGFPVLRSTVDGDRLSAVDGARAVASVLAVGHGPATAAAVRRQGGWAVVTPLAAGGWSATAWAPDPLTALSLLPPSAVIDL
ncbi:MAG: urease accessory protein UreD [Kineosporiaceae bacterium]